MIDQHFSSTNKDDLERTTLLGEVSQYDEALVVVAIKELITRGERFETDGNDIEDSSWTTILASKDWEPPSEPVD